MVKKNNQSENDNQSDDSSTGKKGKTGGVPREKLKSFMISLAIVVISSSAADILLKYSMSGNRAPKVDSPLGIPYAVVEALSIPWLDIAIVLMIIQFITFAHTLRIGPLSLVVPVRGAATYMATTLLAMVFLHEKVSLERWGSILIILIGVVIIGFTAQGKKS